MNDPGDIRVKMDLCAGDNALGFVRFGAVTLDQVDVGHNAVVWSTWMPENEAILAGMSIRAVLVRQ